MGACSGCGGDNRGDAQFCASCGAALAPTCPSCGATPRADARFCDRCGTELGSGSAHGGGAQARKVVTVLFADLVGSTSAQETMDPESVRRWMDRYYAVLRTEVEFHGGRVVKFIGDGMMAVFGVPDVREDDADRAVAAAQAMHEAVAELGGSAAGGEEIGLRVGVNTGEVVVTADDDDVVGDAVNVAARLEQAARPGEVLVGDATFRLVRARAQLRAVPPLDLKGKAEPVPAFLLLSLDRSEEDTSASPFVGRAGELERLTAVLDAAIDDRRPQLASIVGAPGVGKSRLVQELGTAAAGRARVVVVRCDPAGGATFAPVAAVLRAAASLDDDATDETVVAGLTALFDEDEPDRHRIATGAAAILGVGEPGLPEETFWAVRRLIENAARRQALMFVFEDVHWAEPLLIDLIENLATFARDVPVLMVVTARPELRELRPALVEIGGRVTAAIHLEGLAGDESRRLTRALLDGASLPTALLDRVASASEGNPLFVRELVRMLVDDGVLRQQDGAWTAAVDARTVEVPLSIHSVLAARIDRLPAEEQEVLSAASVMGRTFARGAVQHLVSPEVGARLEEHLEGLRRKELVERAGTYWLDEPQLRFHHALVQDAAYRRLLKEARAELHTQAAAWLEAKVGDLAEHDDLIGFQLEQAHLLQTEAGSGDETVGRAAAERLRQAGRRALEADDRPGAAALLGRALTCLPDDDAMRAELLIERCEALLAMGDVTDATPSVAALVALAPGDARLEGWAACFEGELANLRDPRHLDVTAERAAAAAAALAELGDHAGVAKAHSVRAASLARLGRIGECERALDQALGAARAAGDRRRATAILAGAPTAALWGPNPVTRASGRCLDVVRVLRITSRAPAVEAISLRCQAVLEALRGRDDAARRMLASARSSLEELGHALGLIEVDLAAGMVETLAGDLDQAAKLLERAFEGFHELGIDVDAGLAAALLARVRIAQGAPAEALELTRESERLGGEDLKTAIAWRSVRAAALADEGDLTEARRLAEEAVALAEPTDALVDHADALVALAEVLAHAGEEVASADAARHALELYDRKEASVPADHARWLVGAEAAGVEARPGRTGDPASRATRPTRINRAVSGGHRVAAALSPFDPVAVEAATADLVMYDLRPLVGSDEPADAMQVGASLAAIGVSEVRFTPVALRGEHLALLHGDFTGPIPEGGHEGVGLQTLHVVEATPDGRIKLNLIYEVEQAVDAWAELERRYGEHLPPAEAAVWESYRSFTAAVDAHEWDDLQELLTDVYLITSRGVAGAGEGRGNTVDGGELNTAASIVYEVADGRIARTAYFPADRPDLAIDHLRSLDERGASRSEPDGASTLSNECTRRFDAAFQAGLEGEGDRLHHAMSPSIRITDHRPLLGGWEVVGREEAEAWLVGVTRVGFTSATNEVLAVRGERLGLLHTVRWSADVTSDSLHLVENDDMARGCAVDTYDFDQLPEAMARLDERWAELQAREHRAGAFSNVASELFATSFQAALQGDWDRVTVHMHPTAAFTDHRQVVGAGLSADGRDHAIDFARSVVEMGVDDVTHQVVALRGRHLTLLASAWVGQRGTVDNLIVLEVDADARLRRFDVFDEAQLDDALAYLDERFLAGEGADHADGWRAGIRFIEALGRRDVEGIVATLADDFAVVDHRPMGFGVLDRAAYLASLPPAWERSPDIRWILRRDVEGAEGVVLGEIDIVGTRDGGPFRSPLLGVITARGGRVAHLDNFDTDDLEAARACLAERASANDAVRLPRALEEQVLAGEGARHPAETLVRRAWLGYRDAVLIKDRAAALGCFAPGGGMRDHRPIVGGTWLGADLPVALDAFLTFDVQGIDWHPIAIRGDRLELGRMVMRGDGIEVEVLMLPEVDAGGLLLTYDTFDLDQLALAIAQLDERFAGQLPRD